MFAPKIRISVPRSDIEHSTRQLTKVKMGEAIKEYDLLMIKFWIPLSTDDSTEEDTVGDGGKTTDNDEGDADGEGAEGDAEDEEDTAADNATSATAGEDTDKSADTASFVYLTARVSPRLNLWPHPKFKSKKRTKRAMGQVRGLGVRMSVCVGVGGYVHECGCVLLKKD